MDQLIERKLIVILVKVTLLSDKHFFCQSHIRLNEVIDWEHNYPMQIKLYTTLYNSIDFIQTRRDSYTLTFVKDEKKVHYFGRDLMEMVGPGCDVHLRLICGVGSKHRDLVQNTPLV
jgi:hypothetical protein